MKHFSTHLLLGALGALVGFAGCGAGTLDGGLQTQAQQLRVADATPEAVAQMKAAVAPLVSRDFSNVKVVNEPNGAIRREFKSGFRTTVIAHVGKDGKPTVTCVESTGAVDAAMTSPRPSEVK